MDNNVVVSNRLISSTVVCKVEAWVVVGRFVVGVKAELASSVVVSTVYCVVVVGRLSMSPSRCSSCSLSQGEVTFSLQLSSHQPHLPSTTSKWSSTAVGHQWPPWWTGPAATVLQAQWNWPPDRKGKTHSSPAAGPAIVTHVCNRTTIISLIYS